MTQIHIKRVYEPEEATDGYRVLVDKLWSRGVSKKNFHYDLWAKDIAPSTPLRQWYHQNTEQNWEEFCELYIRELEESPVIREFIDKIKDEKTVTLLYGSKNATENHALVLQQFLEGYRATHS